MESYKVSDADLNWLAGIFEGEGSIGVYSHGRVPSPGGFVWAYSLTIVNSDVVILRDCVNYILDITGKMPRIDVKMPGVGRNPIPTFFVRLQDKTSITSLLVTLLPFLRGAKRDQAILMLEFMAQQQPRKRSDRERARVVIDELKRMKRPHANAEVTLAGLRSLAHRNEQRVSANDNPATSVPRESEDVLWPSVKAEEASDKEPTR